MLKRPNNYSLIKSMGEYLSTPLRDKETEEGSNTLVNHSNFLIMSLVEIRSMWDVGMEKRNGGFSHSCIGYRK